eukprot:1913061-Amphidinium_carterae.1
MTSHVKFKFAGIVEGYMPCTAEVGSAELVASVDADSPTARTAEGDKLASVLALTTVLSFAS